MTIDTTKLWTLTGMIVSIIKPILLLAGVLLAAAIGIDGKIYALPLVFAGR